MPESRRMLQRLEPAGDRWLVLSTLFLCAFGLVMVLSASQALALLQHASPFYYFERQAGWMVLGFIALIALSRLDLDRVRRRAPLAAAVVALLMLVVLVPHIGLQVNGARRWLSLGPLGTVQPSEIGKLVFVLYIADWIDRRGERLRSFSEGTLPFALILGGILLLLLLQKDLGTAVITGAILLAAFFTGGGRPSHLVLLVCVLALGFVIATVIEPYRAARLASFANPFADRLGAGFQSTQGLLALGSGGITGVGLGHSVEKYLWLPEAHTDFIFAIVGEETGLIGTTLLLAGFCVFTVRGYRIAMRAPDRYTLIVAASVTTWIGFQALLNMATVTDTLPITGVPLPFVSYGGTAAATTIAAVGVLLNIAAQGVRTGLARQRRMDATLDIGRRDGRTYNPGARGRASAAR
ncbi:MAG TPA: putative lipid II flippase FtsW [Candidatus Dormibacteraeota bacterium]